MGEIKKVAVLGAGVMGSGIAAHLSNAGIPSLLLDILPKDLKEDEREILTARNRFAIKGVENALKAKPTLFYHEKFKNLITTGNIEDDLHWIGEVDWVIEAVVENLDIKRSLFNRLLKYWKRGIIVTSNTSGLSIKSMLDGFPPEFKKNFFVTHFFNPVRYMKLLEIVSGAETDNEMVRRVVDFAEKKLGKGIVYAKDTPNFIANRIGVYALMKTIQIMMEEGLSVEEVDAIVGVPMGRPKSAAFRTCDIVGLDTFLHVSRNVYENLTDDDEREVFKEPDFLKKMVEKGFLGQKTQSGFYKKEGEEILSIDLNKLEYKKMLDVKLDSIKATKGVDEPGERIRYLISGDDRGAKFAWKVLAHTLIYSAKRIGEIADDIVQIDNAMKWGFNWELGPFETWDAIGFISSVERMKKEGFEIPENVEKLVKDGSGNFYIKDGSKKSFFDFSSLKYKEIEVPPDIIILNSLKEKGKEVHTNASCSLIDIGDGVLCLEFHSKMNAIDDDIIEMMLKAADEVEKNWEGLVIYNEGQNFSVGANLALILMSAKMKNWAMLEAMVRKFQKANMRMKYLRKPVCAAPFGLTLGGGCEISIHCPFIQGFAELYIGLVEVGVGVIPAGGGTKETLVRMLEGIPAGMKIDRMPFIQRAFENIALAKVATSAEEGKTLGYLRSFDGITMNRDKLLKDAKDTVLYYASKGYKSPLPPDNLILPGKEGLALFSLGLYSWKLSNMISEHDEFIGKKLANILCGGDIPPNTPVSEDNLLDLECEAFLSLCGTEKTLARMDYMLKTGKPLRN